MELSSERKLPHLVAGKPARILAVDSPAAGYIAAADRSHLARTRLADFVADCCFLRTSLGWRFVEQSFVMGEVVLGVERKLG